MKIKQVAILVAAILIFAFSGYATEIYVSSTTGSHDGDGSKKHPYAAIADIKDTERSGNKIRLRRGDIFFENLAGFRDCEISAYGSGEKPLLCGFHILENTSAWESAGEKIWRIDLKDEANFSGYKAKASDNQSTIYNVGCIYNFAADTIIGHLVRSRELLVVNGDFFTVGGTPDSASVALDPFRYLYLRSDENPAKLGRVGFSVSHFGVRDLEGCKVKDLAITGFSLHGMGKMNNCRVENCDLDVIGGGLLLGYSYWVRFGNGIELLNRHHDVMVKGCYIARTYDCATTIQGQNFVNPYNIRFVKNRIYRCRQAYEYYILQNNDPSFSGCCFNDNISYMAGWNDFDNPLPQDADVLSYLPVEAAMEIRGNKFFGAPYFCGYIVNPAMRGNTVYLFANQYLNFYHGIKDYPLTMPADVALYREKFGDDSRIIVLSPESPECRKIEQEFLKIIKPISLPAKLNIK